MTCNASVSRFCVLWMRKTIRKVTMVVPVFMTSCHVSEKPKGGPVTAQAAMIAAASAKVAGLPAVRAVHLAKLVNQEVDFDGLTTSPPKVLKSESLSRRGLNFLCP